MCGIIICIAPASPFLGDNATSKFNQPRKQTQADNKYQPLLIANEFSQTKTIKKNIANQYPFLKPICWLDINYCKPTIASPE